MVPGAGPAHQHPPTRATRPELWARPPGGPRHTPTPRNPRPANGVLSDRLKAWAAPAPRSQGGGGPSFVVRNGVYVPLQYTDPASPLQGGYGWCDRTDGGLTYHPG